jgi:putative uncharacterized protein XOO4256
LLLEDKILSAMKWWDNFKRNRQLKRKQTSDRRALKRTRMLKNGAVKRKGRAALCLGGGGARGFAHIGALQAFKEAGIDFDIVVGCSAGSIVGALYAAGVEPKDILAHGSTLKMKDIKKGFIWSPDDSMKIGKIVSDIIGDKDFKDLKKPFCAVATDLVEGKQVILDKGSVAVAVAASSTVPLFFKPLVVGDKHLVDGGLLNNIPADVCRMLGADYVVTVDVNPTRGGGTKELGLVSVLKASFDIMGANASVHGLINSDIIVAPDLSAFKATDKEGYEEMYRLGYEAAKAECSEIIGLIYK